MVFVFQNNKVWFVSLVHRASLPEGQRAHPAVAAEPDSTVLHIASCVLCACFIFYSELACRVKVMMYTIVISLLATSTIYSAGVTALSPLVMSMGAISAC